MPADTVGHAVAPPLSNRIVTSLSAVHAVSFDPQQQNDKCIRKPSRGSAATSARPHTTYLRSVEEGRDFRYPSHRVLANVAPSAVEKRLQRHATTLVRSTPNRLL